MGVFTSRGLWGLWLGLSLSHFLLLWVLLLPPLTHLPLTRSPLLFPKGLGSLSGTMCRGKNTASERAGGAAGVGAPRNRRKRPAGPDPAWGKKGEGGQERGRARRDRGDNPLARPDPGPMLPSTRQRLQAPLTRPSPWTALAGRAAGTPRSPAPGPAWTGSQIQDPRRPSLGGLGPAPARRPTLEARRWPPSPGRERQAEALGVWNPVQRP